MIEDDVRLASDAILRAWVVLSREMDPRLWLEVWNWIRAHFTYTDLLLNVTLTLAANAQAELAQARGVDPGTDARGVWAAAVGPDSPDHHRLMGPLMATLGNGEVDAAADLVLGMADPRNDWVLKTIAESAAILTGEPGPPGFFDTSFAVGTGDR